VAELGGAARAGEGFEAAAEAGLGAVGAGGGATSVATSPVAGAPLAAAAAPGSGAEGTAGPAGSPDAAELAAHTELFVMIMQIPNEHALAATGPRNRFMRAGARRPRSRSKWRRDFSAPSRWRGAPDVTKQAP
jgi:hypothetical protein